MGVWAEAAMGRSVAATATISARRSIGQRGRGSRGVSMSKMYLHAAHAPAKSGIRYRIRPAVLVARAVSP